MADDSSEIADSQVPLAILYILVMSAVNGIAMQFAVAS